MNTLPERPVNVLWVIDHVCYDGALHGGGRLYMNLIPKFDSARVKVHPFFLRASDEVRRIFQQADHPVVDLNKAKYDATTALTISKLCSSLKIDVMHTFCYAASTFGRMVGGVRGIPTIIHDFDTQVYFPYPLYLKLLDRVLARKTARAFAASSFCMEYMRDVRNVPSEKLEVLYHAIPESVLEKARSVDRAAARDQLGWSTEDFVFGCITKLGPDRGNEALLEAFRLVVNEVPRARLALVYKPTIYHRVPAEYQHIPWIRDVGAMRAQVEAKVAELNLADRVTLVEFEGSLVPYYAGSDVLVAPFESERFSSVNLVEGLAFGKPWVGSDIGEAREINARFRVGTLVPPRDVACLAAAMIAVTGNSSLLADMSARARSAALYFTSDSAARRFEDLYVSLARPRAAQAHEVGA